MPLEKLHSFSVSHLRVLDEDGNVDEKLDPKLSDEEALRLYRAMLLAREGDQRMLKLQRQGRIGTFGPCTGQEATACGASFAMTEKDWFVGAFRELGGRIMRGDPLLNGLLFHNGYEEGNVLPEPGRTLPFSIIVASQALHAVGLAYAMKYRGEKDSAVVTFMGDGATSQGDFHEAMNFAAVWQAPVVFVCQNNQWAISVPRKMQTHSRTLAQKAIAYDMPGIQVDGNDVLAMVKATRDALKRARAGEGPTFIEGITYRLMMHTTSDDPKRYRTEEEVEDWWKKEPLTRFRAYLTKRGLLDDEKHEALHQEVLAEVDATVKEFESMTEFPPDALFEHVFGTEHDVIAEQREEFLENLRLDAEEEGAHG